MRVWRICETKFANDPLSGQGSFLYGGRWTPAGLRAVYTSTTASLSLLENAVHFSPKTTPLPSYSIIDIDVPDDLIEAVDALIIPYNWDSLALSPHPRLEQIGRKWLLSMSAAGLLVPSVVAPSIDDRNLILNPDHPEFKRIKAGAPMECRVDQRLHR